MKGWAKVNVPCPEVYVVENMVVVKYGSTSRHYSLVSVVSIILYITSRDVAKSKVPVNFSG